MRKVIFSSVCALSLLCGAQGAIAGTYGDPVVNEESPAAPPPAREVEVVEEELEYARTGPYIGVGGVFAMELFDGGMNVDNSNGFHVRAGYRVHPHIAVEARYEHYLNFETDPGTGTGIGAPNNGLGHFEGWSITGNVKGFILTGRWQPYVLFGMGYLDINYPGPNRGGDARPGDDFAMRFGVGMDAHLTEHISIGPEVAYVLPVGDAEDLDFLTIGLGLQFNF
jgi:opacity protein-like surface antigen